MPNPITHTLPLAAFPLSASNDVGWLEASVRVLPPCDTVGFVGGLRGSGVETEGIARVVNRTAHTAFIDDMRLARKIVSVASDQASALRFLEPVAANRRRVLAVIRNFLISGENLGDEFLRNLLDAAGTSECRALKRDWSAGHFKISVTAPEAMDRMAPSFVRDPSSVLGYMRFGGPTIFLRDLPDDFRSGARLQVSQFRRLLDLFFTLIHEWDHWRQFSGRFESAEPSSSPLRPSFWNREAEVAELMSQWEEHRLRVFIGDLAIESYAHARGLTISQFLAEKIRGDSMTPWQRLKRILF